ncbi:ABC-F family ATP-binding cassette domain-containing protein [Sanguibacter suarezii]|uniref:ABC-F family ATP-binding cassette domain-containing protein n=1 Tax=Sanguibacter suarezii TaxID=60921 RepID=UPI00083785B2|nr:ABC-F family ATP-binding cassette domain-containing protein [Sanguibacter suarezii]
MISAHAVELRVGARVLLEEATFRIAPGDRIGLVGRNGAGKTTLTKALAGETQPTHGQITRTGDIGYLPQDPRTGDMDMIAMDRVLSARNLDQLVRAMRDTEGAMASADEETQMAAMERYPALEERFTAAGGYAAESEAERIASNLGLDERVLSQKIGTLSGGQRRRVELARILFSGVGTLLLDEPTNHLDADSIIWLREYLKSYAGGFIVISHDNELMRATVNKVFHLDATRAELDQYNLGWDAYLLQRETDERRRRRERANAEKKASVLLVQAEKMRAKATKAVAAQNMIRRAERMLNSLEGERVSDKVAKLRFPTPAPCGRTPLTATGLSKVYGSQEVFTGVDLAIDRGSRVVILGLNGAGKTTLLRILAGVEEPNSGEVHAGHGLKLGYYAQEHETLDMNLTVVENLRHSAPDLTDVEVRSTLGSFLFSGDDANKPTKVLSGGEKTRLALAALVVSSANVLLLDEPTNNLDPASRAEILGALKSYEGAVVMVTHDHGAVEALAPERVLLLPDGDEDLWNDSYAELIELA